MRPSGWPREETERKVDPGQQGHQPAHQGARPRSRSPRTTRASASTTSSTLYKGTRELEICRLSCIDRLFDEGRLHRRRDRSTKSHRPTSTSSSRVATKSALAYFHPQHGRIESGHEELRLRSLARATPSRPSRCMPFSTHTTAAGVTHRTCRDRQDPPGSGRSPGAATRTSGRST